MLKKSLLAFAMSLTFLCGCRTGSGAAGINSQGESNMIQCTLAQSIAEDSRVFSKNSAIRAVDVRFSNRFGIVLAGHLYYPRDFASGRQYPAIAISGPFGAVKEQVSGLYAQELASRGFVTLAFDPSFYGESSGAPRDLASPDINTEDFSAAVDFLVTRDFVHPEKIGILGVCGWGGLALNAAAIDTRIKATVASTMYDMTRVTANGYNDAEDTPRQRHEKRRALNAQRTKDFRQGYYDHAPCVPKPEALPADAPQFLKDYALYYATARGYHPRSINSAIGWNITSTLPILNSKLLAFADEITSAVLLVHGEKAHSRYFSETAFSKLKGNNKKLLIVPQASHCDLYDQINIIPFNQLAEFYRQYL